jgi:hypothetical protein
MPRASWDRTDCLDLPISLGLGGGSRTVSGLTTVLAFVLRRPKAPLADPFCPGLLRHVPTCSNTLVETTNEANPKLLNADPVSEKSLILTGSPRLGVDVQVVDQRAAEELVGLVDGDLDGADRVAVIVGRGDLVTHLVLDR